MPALGLLRNIMGDKNRKILIVVIDDEPDILTLIKYDLDKLIVNGNVRVFCSPIDAINFIKITTPDIIISDVLMPAMNGIDLCKILKKINNVMLNKVPIIAASAYGDKKTVKLIKNTFDAHIMKPISQKKLISIIDDLIGVKWRKKNGA